MSTEPRHTNVPTTYRLMHPRTKRERLDAQCAAAQTFEQLVAIAINEAKKFPGGCHIVCGPISTGGRGTIEENLRVFSDTIDALRSVPHPVFDQIPYEAKIVEFYKNWVAEDPETRSGQYYMDILERFYLPLFESGYVVHAWYIPGWESSFGASWERKQHIRLNIEHADLTTDWIEVYALKP